MDNNDWRITNQMNYLFKKALEKGPYKPYREGWDHEHCEFCSEKIDSSTGEAYFTEDKNNWICKDCFEDFKDMFQWTLK